MKRLARWLPTEEDAAAVVIAAAFVGAIIHGPLWVASAAAAEGIALLVYAVRQDAKDRSRRRW